MAVALMDIMLDSIPVPLKELQATASAAFWVAYKFFQGSLSVGTYFLSKLQKNYFI